MFPPSCNFVLAILENDKYKITHTHPRIYSNILAGIALHMLMRAQLLAANARESTRVCSRKSLLIQFQRLVARCVRARERAAKDTISRRRLETGWKSAPVNLLTSRYL